MPDATLDDYSALAGKLAMGDDPILPQPQWGQDAAYIAFVIDGLRAELRSVHASMSQPEAVRYEMLRNAMDLIDRYKVLVFSLAPPGSDTFNWGKDNLGEPYKTMLLDVVPHKES